MAVGESDYLGRASGGKPNLDSAAVRMTTLSASVCHPPLYLLLCGLVAYNNIINKTAEWLICIFLVAHPAWPEHRKMETYPLASLCSHLISYSIKSITMQASRDHPDSSPCALLFLLAPSICEVTAEHVQGRPGVLPEGEGE